MSESSELPEWMVINQFAADATAALQADDLVGACEAIADIARHDRKFAKEVAAQLFGGLTVSHRT